MEEAKNVLSQNDEIVYMGWLMAGFVKGLKKVKRYNLKAVCAVGSTPPTDKDTARIGNQNKVPLDKFFLLLGGYDLEKLSGMYRKIIESISKAMKSKLLSKPESEITENDRITLDIVNGKNFVSKDNLAPVIELLKK